MQVALPLQRPVIERYGFEPSPQGVQEMTRAVADFTRGERANDAVKACADETTIAMYGPMWDVCTRPAAEGARPAPAAGGPPAGDAGGG